MDVVLVEQKNRKDWDQFVDESPGVIAWHGYRWADILAKHYGAEFYPFAVYDGSKICGILPLYRIHTFSSGDALISIPHFVAGGIVAEREEVQKALLNKAIALSKELNIPKITLKQYRLKLQGPLVTDENYYNCELTLSQDIDCVWRSISEKNRQKIQEARQSDAKLEYPSTDVAAFYRLLLRDQHAAGVPCVSQAWVNDLFATGAYEIALLRHKRELVAATMVKKFRDTVSFPFSCLRDQSDHIQPFAYSLYWQLITALATEGIRICHSGRIPRTDAAFGYRLGWGGTKYSYYYQYYGVEDSKTEFSSKRGRKRAFVESAWKRLPVVMARAIGPLVVKQFP